MSPPLCKYLPEEYYALLFPNQPLPSWALEKIRLINVDDYNRSKPHRQTVPLAQIMGTTHITYGNEFRWVDMLSKSERWHMNFELEAKPGCVNLDLWPGILNAKTSDMELTHIVGTEDYYLTGEGNHRLSAFKLAGKHAMTLEVTEAYPLPSSQICALQAAPSGEQGINPATRSFGKLALLGLRRLFSGGHN